MEGRRTSGDGAGRPSLPAQSEGVRESSAGTDGVTRINIMRWAVPFVALLVIAIAFFAGSVLLDWASGLRRGSDDFTLPGLFDSLTHQDLEQARNTLGGLGEIMAAVLGLALTVSSIIVQLAATRFTPHVTSLFFRARTNIMVLGFFVVSNVFVLWVNYSVGEHSLPRWGVIGAMAFMTASLLLLFPYFWYVFNFLEPNSIVDHITSNGLKSATPYRSATLTHVQTRQRRAIESIEHLANIGLNAVQQKDKNVASLAVDSLCTFGVVYGDTKAGMVQAWNEIPDWNQQSPDFVSLSDDAVADLSDRGTWMEWKILRQYQMLFNEGLGALKDLCYLIAINTRRLGEAAAARGDLYALDLSIKFFNTYLRATINASDIRTAYNILHQYRQLGEAVLDHPGELPPGDVAKLEERGLEIAKFMRYYSGIAFQRKMSFITEVIAHDVGTLCAHAFFADSIHHDEILATFLKVDETAESKEQETTLRGVRRAQVKLAVTYILHGAISQAETIRDDMIEEPAARLRSIWNELGSLRSREFWEVNDRGSNFDFLTIQQKAQLPRFFSWFPALEGEAAPRERLPTLPPDARPPEKPVPDPKVEQVEAS